MQEKRPESTEREELLGESRELTAGLERMAAEVDGTDGIRRLVALGDDVFDAVEAVRGFLERETANHILIANVVFYRDAVRRDAVFARLSSARDQVTRAIHDEYDPPVIALRLQAAIGLGLNGLDIVRQHLDAQLQGSVLPKQRGQRYTE